MHENNSKNEAKTKMEFGLKKMNQITKNKNCFYKKTQKWRKNDEKRYQKANYRHNF